MDPIWFTIQRNDSGPDGRQSPGEGHSVFRFVQMTGPLVKVVWNPLSICCGMIHLMLLCAFPPGTNGQEYSYKYYGVPDGLAQSQVLCIFQDSRGFIWIGTKGGVSCFDGYSFQNFTENEGLIYNNIFCISEDCAGTLWFGSLRGLSSWNGKQMASFPTTLLSGNNGFYGFSPVGRDSLVLWIGNGSGYLNYVNFTRGRFSDPEPVRPLVQLDKTHPAFEMLYQSSSESVFAATDRAEIWQIRNNRADTIVMPGLVKNIFEGRDGRIYAWAGNAIMLLNGCLGVKILDSNRPKEFRTKTMAVDSKGCIYTVEKPPFIDVIHGQDKFRDGFQFSSANYLFVDRQENLWVGTETGLYRLQSKAFVNFIPGKCGINQCVWSITGDRLGNIWFASYTEGLRYWNGRNFHTETSHRAVLNDGYDNFYMGSLVDDNGDILFTRNSAGIITYNGRGFSLPLPKELRKTVLYLYKDPSDGSILAGTTQGYFVLPKTGEPSYVKLTPGGGRNQSVVSIIRDKHGVLWMGGFDGISLVDHGRVTPLPTEQIPFDLGANAMLADPGGNLWIGNKKGLYVYDYEKFRKVALPQLETMIMALALVGDTGLLVGTARGVAWIDFRLFYTDGNYLLHYFDKDNGFQGIEVGQNGFYRDARGYYWFPTADRVVRFDPRAVSRKFFDIPCYMREISVLNEKMEWRRMQFPDSGSLSLAQFDHDQNSIRFRFVGIDHSLPERVRYSWFLDGYDQSWSEPSLNRETIYTHISPGVYTFRCVAIGEDGSRSGQEMVYQFRIVPAFWQTLWFWPVVILFLAAFFFLSGLFVMNRRKRAYQERLLVEKKMAELQLISIRNQIDPHFTFNAINSIASVILKDEKEKAYGFFVRLSSLIRQVLTSGDRLTRPLSEELAFVKNYLEIEKLRFRDTFDFELRLGPNVNLSQEVPKMVIQTYTENALKHGLLNRQEDGGRLLIDVSETSGMLKIEVEDNGVGREEARRMSQPSTGKGMMILDYYYNFFNRYNDIKIIHEISDLHDVNGTPAGTRVTVRIPAGFRYEVIVHEHRT